MNQAALITFVTSLTPGLRALYRENWPATKLSHSRGRLCSFKMQEFIKLRIFYDFVNISPPIFSTFSFDPLWPASPSLPLTAKARRIQKLSSRRVSALALLVALMNTYVRVCQLRDMFITVLSGLSWPRRLPSQQKNRSELLSRNQQCTWSLSSFWPTEVRVSLQMRKSMSTHKSHHSLKVSTVPV